MQRRSKEEVELSRRETAGRKQRGMEAVRAGSMPTELSKGGVSRKNTRGTSHVPDGVHKTKKRAKKATLQTWRPSQEPVWDAIHSELKLMFGDDCFDIWEDGTVHPNENSRAGKSAWEILGFRTEGMKNRNWGKNSFYRPSAECLLNTIQAFRLWNSRFYGEACGPETVNFVKLLLSRTREMAKTRVPSSRILPAVAGMAYQIVQCKEADKEQFLPNETKWLSMFTGTAWRTLSDKYQKGVSVGHVPRDAKEWLETLPEGNLMLSTKEELAGLLKIRTRPADSGPKMIQGDFDFD